MFNEVLMKLPNLNELTMSGARVGRSISRLPIAGLAGALSISGAPVTRLILEKCAIKLEELDALMSVLSTHLQHHIFEEICSEDKAWPAILRSIDKLDLQSLEISDMSQGAPALGSGIESVCFFDHTHSTAKRLHEYPVASVDGCTAQKYKFSAVWTLMYGRQAVKAGLKALLRFWNEGVGA